MASIISQCSLDVLHQAAENLKMGGLVAFPTETVYGIGADAESSEAIARMYVVKGRPADHPVIIHIADLDAVDYLVKTERRALPPLRPVSLSFLALRSPFITLTANTLLTP